jgi:hypothetical protein
MILEDRLGVLSGARPKGEEVQAGGVRPGLLFQSEDGIHWGEPKIANWTSDHYFGGRRERMERPQILWDGDRPACLFMALNGGKYRLSSGAVLGIEAPKNSAGHRIW